MALEVGDSNRPDHPVSLMVVPDTLTPCETAAQGAGGINGPFRVSVTSAGCRFRDPTGKRIDEKGDRREGADVYPNQPAH